MRKSFRGVGVIFRTRPTARVTRQTPAVVLRIADVIEARGRIPRQKHIALRVTVVSKNVAEDAEVEVVRISKSMSDAFGSFQIGRETNERTGFHFVNRRTRA